MIDEPLIEKNAEYINAAYFEVVWGGTEKNDGRLP
jgi:hypothetical protein